MGSPTVPGWEEDEEPALESKRKHASKAVEIPGQYMSCLSRKIKVSRTEK